MSTSKTCRSPSICPNLSQTAREADSYLAQRGSDFQSVQRSKVKRKPGRLAGRVIRYFAIADWPFDFLALLTDFDPNAGFPSNGSREKGRGILFFRSLRKVTST